MPALALRIPSRWMRNNLVQRLLTGLVAGAASVGLLLSGPEGLLLFILTAGTLAMVEFYRLMRQDWQRWETILAFGFWYTLSGLTYLHLYRGWDHIGHALMAVGLLLLPALSITLLYRRSTQEQFVHLAVLLLGLLYVALPFQLLLVLASRGTAPAYDYRLPLGFLLLLWSSDTAAYLVGRRFGRRPLFPRLSPRKTWEGFLAALASTALLGAWLGSYWPPMGFSWMVLGLIVAVFGLFGDLAESMLKRGVEAKDSGSILPGHGGILDRFDGMLLSLPVSLVYLLLVQAG